MVTGHATVLLVDDVRRSLDYYCDKLGFEVEEYDAHGPVEQGYGLREIRVRDPDGYVLAFGKLLDR